MMRRIWPSFLFFLLSAAGAETPPRAEYPQPQFEREMWQTLNGRWEFEFDDQDAGLAEGWASGARKFTRSIVVPFAMETKLSGIADASFHPVVWYRRTVSVPEAWRGKRVLLHFGAVDYEARVWVNGQAVGQHVGGHTPFQFDITPYLKPARNTLVVRVWDPPQDRSIPRGKQYWELKPRGIFYTRTTGIWQPVWLEATGDAYLEKVRVDAGQDGTAKFEARIARPQVGLELHITVSHEGKPVATAMVPVDRDRAVAAVHVEGARLWSVAAPNLYDLTFELRKSQQLLDRVKSYLGFRSIGLESGRVTINGRPIYLKWVLDQGYWPESTLTPPTDEAIRCDIQKTKEMGFNGCRKHQKLEDPRFLYWADKLGFLVSSEMANAYVFDEKYIERFTNEWIQAVERDYNHPSILMWVPINESWGVPNLRDPRQQNHLRSLYTLTKSLDPHRFVIDNDGWEHTEMTDLFGIHDYARVGALLLERYGDPAIYKPGAAFPRNARAAMAPGAVYNGAPVFLTEFGGIAFIPEGHQVPKESWGYSGIEKTREDALKRMRGLWEAIAKLKPFLGICYTQITDVEQEINGLMTYDRKLKFDPKDIREMNELLQ